MHAVLYRWELVGEEPQWVRLGAVTLEGEQAVIPPELAFLREMDIADEAGTIIRPERGRSYIQALLLRLDHYSLWAGPE